MTRNVQIELDDVRREVYRVPLKDEAILHDPAMVRRIGTLLAVRHGDGAWHAADGRRIHAEKYKMVWNAGRLGSCAATL